MPSNTVRQTEAPTYRVVTYGCQMNVHDSERIAGLLEEAGYVPDPRTDTLAPADVVVFNTCAVRENADNRLYGTLGHMASVKSAHPGMQLAVGGCMAQKDKDTVVARAPWVDVVFGTHNVGSLPALLKRARHNATAQVEIEESLVTFPSNLPTRRDSAYSAWVSILLGQNVNSYGVQFGDRGAFAKLLRACGEIDGLERVRFTSPHPAAFTDDVIEAMAETPNVMPSLHMPLQSGSDEVLRRMRRSYRSKKFLGILDRVREAIPDAAITTDIIVGFPGETDEDFAETMRVVEESRFSAAFTFQYSIRPNTPAGIMEDQVPKPVVQERYERLVDLVDDIAWQENKAQVGRTVEVMFAEGEGRKDEVTHRVTGRARDNRLVHVSLAPDDEVPRPGDIGEVVITSGHPHHLVADGGLVNLRHTRGGDAWQIREGSCAQPGVTMLGIPTIGAAQG